MIQLLWSGSQYPQPSIAAVPRDPTPSVVLGHICGTHAYMQTNTRTHIFKKDILKEYLNIDDLNFSLEKTAKLEKEQMKPKQHEERRKKDYGEND